jgi:hypothetical protein
MRNVQPHSSSRIAVVSDCSFGDSGGSRPSSWLTAKPHRTTRVVGRFGAMFVRIYGRIFGKDTIRRKISLLASLDNHLLRDIGIDRDQIPTLVRDR